MLYFVLFIIFMALIIGPSVAGNILLKLNFKIPMDLAQPNGLNNNDTSSTITGSNIVPGLGAKGTPSASKAG